MISEVVNAMIGFALLATFFGVGVLVGAAKQKKLFGRWFDDHGCYTCRETFRTGVDADDDDREEA